MSNVKTTIRLGTAGKEEVKRDLGEIGSSGDAAAKRWSRSFDRASSDVEAALARQRRAAEKIAAITPQTEMQMRVSDAAGTGYGQHEGSARASAAAFREQYAAQEQAAAAAEKLRAALDPLWVAEARLARELEQVALAEKAGVLSAEQLAQAKAQAQARYDETARAINGEAAAQEAQERAVAKLRSVIEPVAVAQERLNHFIAEARGLYAQGAISAEQLAQAELHAVEQTRLLEAAQRSGAASAGAQRAAMQGMAYQAQDTFTQLSFGAPVLQVLAMQGSQAAGQMTGLGGAAGKVANFMMGPWGLAITGGMLAVSALTEHVLANRNALDSEIDKLKEQAESQRIADQAQEQFGNTLAGVTKAIDDQRVALGKLAEADKTAAERAVETAKANLHKAVAIRQATLAIAEQTAREADQANQVSFGAGGAAGAGMAQVALTARAAEAQRQAQKAQEEVAQAQKNLATANFDLSVEGAKRAASAVAVITKRYDDQIAAIANRDRALIASGKQARSDSAARITDLERQKQAAIEAENGKEAAARKAGREAARAAKEAAKSEREHEAALRSLEQKYDPLAAAAREYREELQKIASLGLDKAIAGKWADGAREGFVKARADLFKLPSIEGTADQTKADEEARIETDRQRRERAGQYLADQQAGLQFAQRELSLIGANDNYREQELDRLRLILSLKRDGIDSEGEEGQRILETADAYAEVTRRLREQQDVWNEVTSFGEHFIDNVLDPQNWDDWGQLGKNVLRDLEYEFMKLEAINPLKNALFGSDLPTLGSMSSIGGSPFGWLGHNASGTDRWSGGLTWVGENGPEIANLPEGTRIHTASESRRMMAPNDQTREMTVRIALDSDLLHATVDQRSANVSVQVVRAMAPGIQDGAIAKVSAMSGRPTI